MKTIKVRFAGIETSKPYDGNLTIYCIPDNTQILQAGKKYEIIIEGLGFDQKDTRRKKSSEVP